MKRVLNIAKIKEECIDEYIKAHDNIWPELEEEYRQRGVTNITCFLDGSMLFVYMEYDEEKINEKRPVEIKWHEYMSTLTDASWNVKNPREVYRLKGAI